MATSENKAYERSPLASCAGSLALTTPALSGGGVASQRSHDRDNNTLASSVNACACGCGELTTTRFVRGHNHRGKKHSNAWKQKQAEGVKRAWEQGKYKDAKPLDYAAIAEKNRGRKKSESAREATRVGVKKAWANGAYSKPETRKKHLEHLQRLAQTNQGAPAARMDQIRAMRDMEKLRPILSATMKTSVEKWRADGTMQKNVDWNRKRLTGGHGLGKNQLGSLEHSQAKVWQIRSPLGVVYEFVNCREWVRRNIHLFHDYRPESRMPFPLRVSSGLKNIREPKHENAPTHYQGWTTLAAFERGDLLGRDEAELRITPAVGDSTATLPASDRATPTPSTPALRPENVAISHGGKDFEKHA